MPEEIIDSIKDLIAETTRARAAAKEEEAKRIITDPTELASVLTQIKKEESIENSLVDTTNVNNFYNAFHNQCKGIKSDVEDSVIKKMFSDLIKELFLVKLKIYDARNLTDAPQQIARIQYVDHEGMRLLLWTEAQEKVTGELKSRLDEVFKPLFEGTEAQKANLWTKAAGNIRAKALGHSITLDNPGGIIYDTIADVFNSVLMPKITDATKGPEWERDLTLSIVIWKSLSAQYVMSSKGDIDVFLPEGEITTANIFWNTELNQLKKMEFSGEKIGQKITYHRLTEDAKKGITEIDDKIKAKQEEITKVKTEIDIQKDRVPEDKDPKWEAALQERKKHIEDDMAKLNEEKYKLTAADKSWETVEFEKLKFKGLKAHGKSFTVGDMLKHVKVMEEFAKQVTAESRLPTAEKEAAKRKRKAKARVQALVTKVRTIVKEKRDTKSDPMDISSPKKQEPTHGGTPKQ